MNKINFENGGQPAVNDVNLNQMQTNIENEINALINKLTGSVLYENSTGSSTSVTLSESVTNFDYIEIYFAGEQGGTYYYNLNKLYNPNNKQISLLASISGSTNLYFIVARGFVSGTNISIENNRRVYFSNNNPAIFDNTGTIYITKVIGYKY